MLATNRLTAHEGSFAHAQDADRIRGYCANSQTLLNLIIDNTSGPDK